MTNDVFDFLLYSERRESVTGSPWQISTGSIVNARKGVREDLVDDPGMPEYVFTKSAVVSAELQAELMNEKYEDVVVTLVVKVRFSSPTSIIRVESLRHSQLAGRITEMKQIAKEKDGHMFVVTAYSEATKQEFWWNDMKLNVNPKLPGYEKTYDRKRKYYRTSESGVIQDE